jgi:hypothetical protein
MKHTVFIQTNNKQRLGAIIAKYAIESQLKDANSVTVKYINVDELAHFKTFVGSDYLFSETEHRIYKKDDLQSFTLSRFMPPELMGYGGKAIVIDPDIFALTDIEELFSIDLGDHALAACRKKNAWDTSVMLMDCSKLKHWKISTILQSLKNHTVNYSSIMTLSHESVPILELERKWNHLDEYTPETKIIHMTGRLTQPWRTGLPIDFTRNAMRKMFGLIPREPIYKLLGKYETHYQPHPNKTIEELFFKLVSQSLKDGALSREQIEYEIQKKHVRSDIFEMIPLGTTTVL